MSTDRPLHPPEAFTPDSVYKSSPLPDDVWEWVDRKASVLTEAYDHAADGYAYEDDKAQLLDDDHVKWRAEGSERTIVSLGRTFEGKFIDAGDKGVVVKFTPWLRVNDNNPIQVVRSNGNLYELTVWSYANDHGDAHLFAPILDWSKTGDWLAQQEVLPVYRHGTGHNRRVDVLRENIAGTSYCDAIAGELKERGYDPHTKDGNVGLDLPNRRPVMIDYGAHFGIEGVDPTDYALEETNG